MNFSRSGRILQKCVRSFASKPRIAGPISVVKPLAIGIGIGITAGTVYTVFLQQKNIPGSIVEQKSSPITYKKLPEVKIMRHVVNPLDKTGLEIILFQFQTCPFCSKVRSYLDFKGLSYSIVEVDAVLRQSLKFTSYKKVPLVLVKTRDGNYLQLTDSSMIISILETVIVHPEKDILEIAKLYPAVSYIDDEGKEKVDIFNKYHLMHESARREKEQEQLNEKKWRAWADDHLVHLISPNTYRNRNEAFETFEWFSEAGEWDKHFPAWERNMMVYVGAVVMYLISKRLKKKYGLDDDVRSHLYDACDKVTKELDTSRTKFLGGQEPNLADLAVFGVLLSMEGCRAWKDCLENTKISTWFNNVKQYVLKHKGARAIQ